MEDISLATIDEQNLDDNSRRMLYQAEMVKQLLTYCSFQPDAEITITVRHRDGHVAIAQLFDHAALVQSLYQSLEYFQSEML